MQSRRYKIDDSGAPNTGVTSDKAMSQVKTQEVFKRMLKVLIGDSCLFEYILVKDGKDYTIAADEAVQFTQIGILMKQAFILKQRDQHKNKGWQFVQYFHDESGVKYVAGFQLILDSAEMPPQLKHFIPVEFSKNAGKTFCLTMFVNQSKTGVVILSQITDCEPGVADATDIALDYAAYNTYTFVVNECSACKEQMPVMKKCKVCLTPFCSKECMKAAWSKHKTVCRRTEAAAPAIAECTEATSKLSLRDDKCPCGEPGTLICTRCKQRWYCSKECQKACWYTHFYVCKGKKHVDKPAIACPKCQGPMGDGGAAGALCSGCSQ